MSQIIRADQESADFLNANWQSGIDLGGGTVRPSNPDLKAAFLALCKLRHSRDSDNLLLLVSERYPEREFAASLSQEAGDLLGGTPEDLQIPDYVYDVHTRRGKSAGKTKKMFMRDEEAGLFRGTSEFDNLEQMIQSPSYVAPVGRLF